MSTRKVVDARDITNNELVYFKSHAKATYMSNGVDVETAIDNSTKIITKQITSDSTGKLSIEIIDGYTYLTAISFDNNKPLNIIRFGDDVYVGFYDGADIPHIDSAVSLMFTAKANKSVTIFYIKNI